MTLKGDVSEIVCGKVRNRDKTGSLECVGADFVRLILLLAEDWAREEV
jgi:hypothetical protein